MKIYVSEHIWDFDLREALEEISAQRRGQALRFKYSTDTTPSTVGVNVRVLLTASIVALLPFRMAPFEYASRSATELFISGLLADNVQVCPALRRI